jgi:PelA/Pel-15E family pectate lyase
MPQIPRLWRSLSLAVALAGAGVVAALTHAAAADAPPVTAPAAPKPAAPPPVATERLLVLQKNAELLSGFDPETGDRSGTAIRVFAVPHEMAATADGALLFITNYGAKSFRDPDRGSNMVTIVDAHRVAHAGSVDLGAYFRPHGIARGRSGRFYVTTDTPAALLAIDPVQRAVVARFPLDQKLPHMVVVTDDETRAVVANAGSATLTVVALDGNSDGNGGAARALKKNNRKNNNKKKRTAVPTPQNINIPIGGTPMGMVLSTDGRWLYASNRDGNQIVRIDMHTPHIDGTIPVAGEPTRLALAAEGRVLVASLIAGNAVVAIDIATSKELARISVGRRPEAILLDAPHQRGFVSVQDDDKVVEFSTADWKVIREIQTADHPDALWLDRAPALADHAQAEEVDGNATPLLTPERLAHLSAADHAAWTRYLETSARLRTADQALIAAELKATGKPRMIPAPYRKLFHVESPSPAWFAGAEGQKVTAAVLSFQTPSGGWSKHVDLRGRPRKPGESFYSETDGWQYIATLDNDSTTDQIRYLAAAFAATGDAKVRAAFARGMEYLFTAQFPNGCWPQVYPLQGGYHDAVTFNDDAIVNVMRLLDDVAAPGRIKAATPEQAHRAAAAATRGQACIIASQVSEGSVRAIWSQQADPLTLEPVPARRYELAGLAGREGASVASYLMSFTAPSPDVVEAVHAAVAWFQAHAIADHDYDVKNGLRKVAGGGPIWARLVEVGTGKPIFSNRDGIKHYSWSELTDRRFGYTWYCREPAEVLAGYPAWAHLHPRAAKKEGP